MSNNGKQGERLFYQIMQSRNYGIQDTTDNPDFWYKDIDFILTSPATGLVKSFEVKWDKRINGTGNLYLELSNVHSIGGNGWWQFCEADFLAYGDAVRQVFYIIPMAQLRERVRHLPKRYKKCGQDSIGQLVRLRDIADITAVL